MRRREVVIDPDAYADLEAIYDWIADHDTPGSAYAYVKRIKSHCAGFDLASERGRRRDDIRDGLRITGFRRKVEIAFVVDDDCVTILRIF